MVGIVEASVMVQQAKQVNKVVTNRIWLMCSVEQDSGRTHCHLDYHSLADTSVV